MSISYNQYLNTEEEGIPIARHGEQIIFYHPNNRIDLRDDLQDEIYPILSTLVDIAKEKNRLLLDDYKLLDLENDILNGEIPSNKNARRIYFDVMNILNIKASKLLELENGSLQLLPRGIDNQNDRIYIPACSGAGKTYWCKKYADEYHKQNPTNKIYLFSAKSSDRVIDSVEGLVRVPLDRSFLSDQIRNHSNIIGKYENSLCIFDDFHKLSKDILNAVLHLKDSVMQLGRDKNIYVVSITHKALGGFKTISEIGESSHFVLFPKASRKEAYDVLLKFFPKVQTEDILRDFNRTNGRFLILMRPNVLISENSIRIIE